MVAALVPAHCQKIMLSPPVLMQWLPSAKNQQASTVKGCNRHTFRLCTPAWLVLAAAEGRAGDARPLKLAGNLRPEAEGDAASPALAGVGEGRGASSGGASGAGAALMREKRPSSSMIFTPFSFACKYSSTCYHEQIENYTMTDSWVPPQCRRCSVQNMSHSSIHP